MNEMTEWRDVVGFEGLYQVSDCGGIRSLPRSIGSAWGATRPHPGQTMTPVLDKDGYPRVVLRVNGEHYTRKVHRLVCEAFNGPPNILHREVDHIDGNRANADASNLRWVSRGENAGKRHRAGGRGETIANSILTAGAVIEIRKARGTQSAKSLAQQFGVSHYAIYDVWKGRRWQHVA